MLRTRWMLGKKLALRFIAPVLVIRHPPPRPLRIHLTSFT